MTRPGSFPPRRLLPSLAGVLLAATASFLPAAPSSLPRCEAVPLPEGQVSLTIDGTELVRWHGRPRAPRPFFFPFAGPEGGWLTRMGHPGAANHDHHRSIWFAHHDVEGTDFWSDQTTAVIRQKHWLAYADGDEEAILAVSLGWHDATGAEVLRQELIAALLPLEDGEHALELQATFTPAPGRKTVRLGQTNFGFLAVRLAKSLSEYFGSGTLTGSDGSRHEEALFGQPARWIDASGPVPVGTGPGRRALTHGITYHDHPSNPRYPSRWHVRQDGWMGASFCLEDGFSLTHETPLRLRYLLHAHRGPCHPGRADAVHAAFAHRPPLEVLPRTLPHGQWDARRAAPASPPATPPPLLDP